MDGMERKEEGNGKKEGIGEKESISISILRLHRHQKFRKISLKAIKNYKKFPGGKTPEPPHTKVPRLTQQGGSV